MFIDKIFVILRRLLGSLSLRTDSLRPHSIAFCINSFESALVLLATTLSQAPHVAITSSFSKTKVPRY